MLTAVKQSCCPVGLLGCNAVHSCVWLAMFRRDVTLLSSRLNRNGLCSSETSVTTYKTARCHNPEDYNLYFPDTASVYVMTLERITKILQRFGSFPNIMLCTYNCVRYPR